MSGVARPDVVVIGGGIIGCVSAWRLAQHGLAVLLVERGTPGQEATWAAGGMLSPLSESEQPGPFFRLALSSFERYGDFVDALQQASGVDVDHRASGKLHVALSESDQAALAAQHRWQSAAGHGVELVSGDQARRLEPALSGDVLAALLFDPDHSVDSRSLGRAAWVAAARAGVEIRTGAAVNRVEIGSEAVRGVVLEDGSRIDTERLIIAAGAWSGTLAGLPRPLPIEPARGQMLAVETLPPLLRRVVLSEQCYLIPRSDGRVVVGATVEWVGFQARVTAGGIAGLLRAAVAAAPALAAAPLLETWAGLRPGTPDDLPILGADPVVTGLIYATGHFRNGILLAPITAEIVTALVLERELPLDIAPFSIGRFSDEGPRERPASGA